MAPRLRALALQWTAWAAVARLGQDGLRMAGRLILARLLGPEPFGLFALVLVIVAGSRALCELELTKSVVQRRAASQAVLSTAHWSQVGLGAIAALALLALASPLSALTGHPGVAPLLQVMSLQLLLGGFATVPRAWLWRHLDFRRLATRGLVSEGVGSVAGIAAALAGAGVWSLAVQELMADVMSLLLLWAIIPWRPSYHWSRREFAELFRFGSPVLGSQGLEYLRYHGDRFIVGRTFGSEALGFYAMAQRLAESVAGGIGTIFARVAFPAFARTQDDPARSQRGFLVGIRFQGLFTFPALAIIGVLAEDLVPLILGRKWTGAVSLTRIFAGRALVGSFLMLPRAMLLGRGRAGLVLGLSLCGLAVAALGWWLGLPWGPSGLAWSGMGATALLALIVLPIVSSELDIRASEWGRALLPSVGATVAMILSLTLAKELWPGIAPGGAAGRVALLLLIGGAFSSLVLLPWSIRELPQYLRLLRETSSVEAAPSPFIDEPED